MALKITQQPSEEPVSLSEAKLHLRVDDGFTDDDALIMAMIAAARQQAEMVCRRSFVTQKWLLALDQFPAPSMNVGSANWYGPQWGNSPGPLTTLRAEGRTGHEIYLPNPPLQSVDSLSYVQDLDGATITLAPAAYIVDMVSDIPRLMPAYNSTWPGTRNQINAVQVAYTAGYGAASQVPEGIKMWIKLRLGSLYENREEFVILQKGKLELVPYVDTLLNPFRVMSF